MADLVSMRADAAAIRQDMEHILATDGELSVEQVAELDAKREKLEGLQDQVNRAESVSAAKEALARPTFNFPSEQRAQAAQRHDNACSRTQFRDNLLARMRGEPLNRFIDFSSSETGATGNASDLLPVDLQNEFISRLLPSVSGVLQAATVRTYNNDVEVPIASTRATITAYTGEGEDFDSFEPDFSKVRIRSFKSTAETEITQEVLMDSRPSVVEEMLRQHAEEHSYFQETRYMQTTAPDSANAPAGLFAAETALDDDYATEVDGNLAIFDQSTASGETAISNVSYEDLLAVNFGMPAKYWGLPKSWLMSPALYQHIISLKDNNDRPLFLPGNTGNISQEFSLGTLLGHPVYVSDAMTDATPAGSFQAVLLERGSYVVALRNGVTTQVDEFSKGSQGMTVFRSFARHDGRWIRPSSSARLKISAT